MKKNFLALLLTLALGSFSYFPLSQKGFYPSHDDMQVRRIKETYDELKYKTFPVRWLSGLSYGYGYPLLNFYSPLVYYVGAALMTQNIDPIIATKITIIAGFILSSVFMFLLGKELFGTIGGIIAAVFYTYAPFHAVEIYVRGSLTEFWAFVPLPLIFYSLIKKHYLLASISIALLILSHHVLAILFAPVLLLYLFFLKNSEKPENFQKNIVSLIVGLGLSAFFWLPSFVESSLTRAPLLESLIHQSYKSYFLPLIELINKPWGYEGFSLTNKGAMSFEIGKLHLLLVLISIFLAFKKLDKNIKKFLLFSLISFLFSIFMVTPYSQKIWEIIPYFIYTHFPWRYLAIAAFFASILAGSTVLLFKKNNLKILYFLVLIITLFLLEGYKFNPRKMNPNYKIEKYDLQDTTTWEYQYLPIWLQKPVESSANQKLEVLTSKVKIENVIPWHTNYSFDAEAEGFARIRFNNYYFPGWNLYIDGKAQFIDFYNENNLITFIISPGKHHVELKFEETPIRKLGNLISVFSVILLIYVLKNKKIS